MNSQPTSRPTTFRFKPVSRAQFSPVRSHPRISSEDLGDGLATATSMSARRFRKPELTVSTPSFAAEEPIIRLAPAWPAWHRGPLDRMQSPLTRFHD